MNIKHTIEMIVNQFQRTKILCIGDVMLDRFIYGDINRISPEAPVPVMAYTHETVILGGAGNVAANLAALGAHVTFLGLVGYDEVGRQLSSMFKKKGVHSHLLRLINYPTIEKIRLISGSHHVCRLDKEKKFTIPESAISRLQKSLIGLIKNVDLVLFSDYDKGTFTQESCQAIIQICRQYHKPILVDPKGNDWSKYAGVTLIKPNRKEFYDATGIKLSSLSESFKEEFKQGAKQLFSTLNIDTLLVTLSEQGMAYINRTDLDQVIYIPTQSKEVFDVSGAGDTVLATLGAAIASGVSVADAMTLANIASGIVVGKVGTSVITQKELIDAFKSIIKQQ